MRQNQFVHRRIGWTGTAGLGGDRRQEPGGAAEEGENSAWAAAFRHSTFMIERLPPVQPVFGFLPGF
jgi:hypothetical protein